MWSGLAEVVGRRARCLVLLAGLIPAFFPAGAPARSNPFSDDWTFHVGSWLGKAYRDSSGAFSHCAITTIYRNGITLGFGITAQWQLNVAMYKSEWSLPTGAEYQVGLEVDGKSLGSFPAGAVGSHLIVVTLGGNADVLDALRKGYTLTVRTAKTAWSFSLKDTFEAFRRTSVCVRNHLAQARNRGNPFADGGGSAAGSGDEGPVSGRYLRILLTMAGLDGVRLAEPAETVFKDARFAWDAGDVSGAVYVLDPDGAAPTVESVSRRFVAVFGGRCTGQFASNVHPTATATASGTSAKRVDAACRMKNAVLYISAAVVKTDSTMAVFVNESPSDAETPGKASAYIADYFVAERHDL